MTAVRQPADDLALYRMEDVACGPRVKLVRLTFLIFFSIYNIYLLYSLSFSTFSHRDRQVQLIEVVSKLAYIIYIFIIATTVVLLTRYKKKNNKIQTSWMRLSYKRPLSRTVYVCRVVRVKLIDTRVRGIPRPDISAAAAAWSARNKWVSARTYLYLIIPVYLPSAYIIQWKYKPTMPNLLHSSIHWS